MCLEDRDRGGSHQVSRGPESGEDGSAREVPRAPDPTLMTGCPTVLHSNLPKNTDARPCWVPPAGSTFIGFRLLRGCMMCASLFLTPSCQFSDSSLSRRMHLLSHPGPRRGSHRGSLVPGEMALQRPRASVGAQRSSSR